MGTNINMKWVERQPEHIKEQIYAQLDVPQGNVASSITNLEQDSGNASARTDEAQAFSKRVIVIVHSYRHKLTDPDGICAKWTIDALTRAGILKDDSSKDVEEIRYKQYKIQKTESEYTEIEVIEER